MILSAAIQGYLLHLATFRSMGTYKLYELYLRQFVSHVGDRELKTIKADELSRYLVYLKTEYIPKRVQGSTRVGDPLSASALDNHWKCLRSFWGWASLELHVKNVALKLPRAHFEMPEVQPFSQAEVAALFHVAQFALGSRKRKRPNAERNHALLLLLLDTGMRVGELARLKVKDVLLTASEVYIAPYGTGRKTKSRNIPLGRQSQKALWLYLTGADPLPDASLFGLTEKSIRGLLLRLGAAAQVPHCHPHRFRHTFAIEYLRNGGDIFTLQHHLGHNDLATCRRYLALVQNDFTEVHRRASPADRWHL
jgi:integrase/recombinase XerD